MEAVSRVRAELKRRLGDCLLLEFAKKDKWHEKQLEILDTDTIYTFLCGGNGAGKTFLGSRWLAGRMLGFDLTTGRKWEYTKQPNFYAVGPSFNHVERVMIPAMKQWIPHREWVKPIGRDYIGELRNGSRLFFKSVEAGGAAFQGDEVDACWIDEEPKNREVWDEINGRTFRRRGPVLITMTPWQGTRWLHTFMFSDEEMDRKFKKIVRMALDENPYYRDKPDMVERAHRQWKGMTKQVRFYGHFHLLAGKPVFDKEVRKEHEEKYRTPPVIGSLNEQLKFVESKEDSEHIKSWLRVCKPPDRSRDYVMGVDAGGGNPLGDYHAAVVVDKETGECVALAHTRVVEPRHFGILLHRLAKVYNDAHVVVEANNHGISVIDSLKELQYGNLYTRQIMDRKGILLGNKVGFWTDGKSKPEAVDLMVDWVGKELVKVLDPLMHREMFHYYWLEQDRPGHYGVGNENPEGHDDTMAALFCACVGLRAMGFRGMKVEEVEPAHRKPTLEEEFFEDALQRQLDEDELLAFSSDLDTFDEGMTVDPFGDIGTFE